MYHFIWSSVPHFDTELHTYIHAYMHTYVIFYCFLYTLTLNGFGQQVILFFPF